MVKIALTYITSTVLDWSTPPPVWRTDRRTGDSI